MVRLTWKKIRVLLVLFGLVSFALYFHKDPTLFFLYTFRNATDKTCACHQCVSDVKSDAWFSEKFNQSIHPLLSRSNSELSNDTYQWWLWLQGETNPANLNSVLNKAFQLFPGEERYMDAGPSRCRSCSVVGNSGNLKASKYGKLIDASDFVIRINQGPVKGFEEDVGSRTTHHVMYPESAVDMYGSNTSILFIPFKTLDLEWLISAFTTRHINFTYMTVLSEIKANKDDVLLCSPTFMKYIYESWLENHGRYPSTGFISIVFALHICDEVNVFGFGANANGDWHHYWEEDVVESAFKETSVHRADYEYNITLQLATMGKIRLHKGTSEVHPFGWEQN